MKSRSVVVFLVGSEAGDDNNVILAGGWTQKSGLRSIHFLTLIVKCSVTTCTVLDLSLWHQDGGWWRQPFNRLSGDAMLQ